MGGMGPGTPNTRQALPPWAFSCSLCSSATSHMPAVPTPRRAPDWSVVDHGVRQSSEPPSRSPQGTVREPMLLGLDRLQCRPGPAQERLPPRALAHRDPSNPPGEGRVARPGRSGILQRTEAQQNARIGRLRPLGWGVKPAVE